MRILVVDDSEAVRKVMAELLVRSGFHDIAEASCFEEAVEQFKAFEPDVTFADMLLPGKSGVELTKEIISIDPDAKVVAMSSIVNRGMIKESLASGAKDFLLKPTNEIALSSVLAMWSD